MLLRDEIAAQFMAALLTTRDLSTADTKIRHQTYEWMAREAFQAATAFIAARGDK